MNKTVDIMQTCNN